MILDSVHFIKYILQLALHLHTGVLANLGEFIAQYVEGFDGLGQIDNHHHVEILLHDGLGNIKDIDLVVCQIGADLGDDAHGVLAPACPRPCPAGTLRPAPASPPEHLGFISGPGCGVPAGVCAGGGRLRSARRPWGDGGHCGVGAGGGSRALWRP